MMLIQKISWVNSKSEARLLWESGFFYFQAILIIQIGLLKGIKKMRKRLFFITVFIFFVFAFGFQIKAAEVISVDAPMEIYLIGKTGDGNYENSNFSNKLKSLFFKRLRTAGFHVLDDQDPPFVSKTMEHYGLFRGGKNQSSGIGYVHLSLTDMNSVHYFSDSGQEVILKSDPKSVIWLFEEKKALTMADKAGAKYAFVINVTTQLIYQNDSPKPVYNVSLDTNLYQADTGHLVFSQTNSMVKLAVTAEMATSGACQFLSQKLIDEMQDNQFSNP
jgi:hypothetical protein